MQLLQRVAAVIRAFHREDQPPIITENRVIPYGFDGRGAGISLGGRLHGILSFRGGGTGCSTCPAACQKQPCTRQKFCELPSVQNFSPITCVWKRSSSEYRHHQRQHLRQHGRREAPAHRKRRCPGSAFAARCRFVHPSSLRRRKHRADRCRHPVLSAHRIDWHRGCRPGAGG